MLKYTIQDLFEDRVFLFFFLLFFFERNKTPRDNRKQNLNTKWHLLQNKQNADVTLSPSHDELAFSLHAMMLAIHLRNI